MSLFSLDILEPALVSRSSSSPRIPLQSLSSDSTAVPSTPSKQPRKTDEPGPPRWNTPEFWFYGLAFLTVVPVMFWTAWDVSRRSNVYANANEASNPNYSKYVGLLSDGWILGRKVVCSVDELAKGRIPAMLNTLVFEITFPFSLVWWCCIHYSERDTLLCFQRETTLNLVFHIAFSLIYFLQRVFSSACMV
jgi:hypothetical protein